jgi:cytochrome c5
LHGVALPERLGTVGNAGVLVTKSGLVFVGGGDPFLYAFDKATGNELGRVATPFRTSANPMTYRTRSGRQFVVIATGGGPDATLAAFTLGSGRPTPAAAVDSAGPRLPGPSGAAAYMRICQPCHGAEGRGGLAPALAPMTRGVGEVRAIVREGIGQMPPISLRELSEEEVSGIVEYLRLPR